MPDDDVLVRVSKGLRQGACHDTSRDKAKLGLTPGTKMRVIMATEDAVVLRKE
jgi:hypothetical protein